MTKSCALSDSLCMTQRFAHLNILMHYTGYWFPIQMSFFNVPIELYIGSLITDDVSGIWHNNPWVVSSSCSITNISVSTKLNIPILHEGRADNSWLMVISLFNFDLEHDRSVSRCSILPFSLILLKDNVSLLL